MFSGAAEPELELEPEPASRKKFPEPESPQNRTVTKPCRKESIWVEAA